MGVVEEVLLKGLALDRGLRDALSGDGRSGMILVEKMLQDAQHFSAQLHQGLDQNRRLDRHVQGAGDAGALQGFAAVFLAQRHQTGHFGLGNVELLAAEIGLIDIGNDAIDAELQLSRDVGAATMVRCSLIETWS